MSPPGELLILILLLFFFQGLWAQKTYRLHWDQELALTGLALGSNLAGHAFGQNVHPLKSFEISALNRKDVFVLDRAATYWRSNKADNGSTRLVKASMLTPALLMVFKEGRKEVGEISLLYLETYALTLGLTQITKSLVKRTRPFAYNPDTPLYIKEEKDTRKSFFSGHTSSAASACFFTAKVWTDQHPGNRWNPAVWTVAATVPAITGYLRMRAGRHFLTDVLAGYGVGATLGYFIPELHRNKKVQKSGVGFYGTGNGVGLVWNISGKNKAARN